MDEIDSLRTEVAELREATRVLLTITTSVLATSRNSAEAAKALAQQLKAAEEAKPRSDTFWDGATSVLRMLSSVALRQHPNDAQLLDLHHGVRPNRH